MKKILVLVMLGFILSGCATYKFQHPAASGGTGYLACYDGKPILEYTAGKEKSLPDLTLAKERFKRRRKTVENYYKQMGLIESRLKEFFWDPPAMFVDLLGGVLRWPFVAVADYKYNRDPKYKEKIDRLDEQKEELEKARVNLLKEKLAAYIVEDLNKESSTQNKAVAVLAVEKPELTQKTLPSVLALPAVQEVPFQAKTPVLEVKPIPEPVVVEPVKEIKPVVREPPVAVIVAKPAKGYSPLIVNFSGQQSYSKSGKIVAYDWNFGDGDTSTKKNPQNTYWSTTFGPRNFTVTLTVRDQAGFVSSATSVIEVTTH